MCFSEVILALVASLSVYYYETWIERIVKLVREDYNSRDGASSEQSDLCRIQRLPSEDLQEACKLEQGSP